MGSYYVQTKLILSCSKRKEPGCSHNQIKAKPKVSSVKCSVVDLWAPFMVFWAPACLDSFPPPAHLRGLDWSLAVTHPRGTAISSILGSPWQLKLHLHQQLPQTSLQGLQPFYPVPGLSYSLWPHLAFKPVTPLRCSLGRLWSTASVCWSWKNTPKRLTSVFPVSSWSALISLFPITSVDCPIKTEVSP